MAQHKSAEKRNRQTIRRTAVNRIRVGRIRSTVKDVEAAIALGDKAKAQAALKTAQPVIMSGVSKGVLKLATASRKMSRLSARVKAIGSTA
jgi:small subunit ribosomal protein S20